MLPPPREAYPSILCSPFTPPFPSSPPHLALLFSNEGTKNKKRRRRSQKSRCQISGEIFGGAGRSIAPSLLTAQGIGRRRSETLSAIVPEMESASSSPPAADEQPRVKFLCSFGGSILPRPLDGRLRYVGGETRIVSVPRDVSFEDLMARMRELFEGAAVIKYQQPDEDLDALVSVVNDDDVMNMMEEYDKLGSSGDGLVRLRIFLFSQQQTEIDAATTVSHFDTNERETERRYVDALNSLTDTKPQPPPDATEQFFWPPGIDGGVHTHLHHLNIPHPSRYGDMETSWSPVYYSPGHHTPHDPREFPSSPPSARYQIGVGELSDRIPEEYVMQSPGYQPQQYDHQSPSYVENVVWLPPGAIIQEKAGFPGNLAHSHNVVEGSNICKNCLMAFQTQSTVPDARYLDPRWKHGQPHMEQFSSGNEYMVQFSKSCAERYRGHEAYMLTQECYNDSHLLHQHQLNHRLEDLRLPASGNVRASEHYVVDANGMKLPYAQSHACDVRSLPSSSINPDGTRYLRPANETGNEVLHAQQTVGGAPHAHIPGVEDTGAQYVNYPSAYGLDNLYPLQHNLPPVQPLWRNPQAPMHPGPPYEPGLMIPNGKSPRYTGLGVDEQNQSPWAAHNGSMPQRISGPDGSSAPENLCKMNLGIVVQDVQRPAAPSSTQCQPVVMHVEVPGDAVLLAPPSSFLNNDRVVASPGDHQSPTLGIERVVEDATKEAHANSNPSPKKEEILEFDKEGLRPTEEGSPVAKVADSDAGVTVQHRNISAECLSFLPELIASVKKAVLEGAEEVKARAEANADAENPHVAEKKESSVPELEPGNTDAEVDADSDNEHPPKIEPTVAEADALARGLQTIKNADLEEIRELGSGTYGAVYHGKWKGSDVAIKRIKASCFAGRPSERERLIADFWKEALILSSLHHPNVVSFYGVVRDGPDGSLATVTEFMVNGSLKQFLQKKDRTIDRRKRLILAMDAAFGMEYLHGKNIVHFDLKCENLLVNMRDPHRPICKIGDLGLSKVKQHTLVSGGVRGTLPWMAPELLNGKSNMVTEKIDVYSFGIVMWELLTGEEPYADMRCASIIGGIVNDSLRPQIPTWCDPEWKSLMESCWSGDPGKRPSFTEISQKLRKMSAAMNVK